MASLGASLFKFFSGMRGMKKAPWNSKRQHIIGFGIYKCYKTHHIISMAHVYNHRGECWRTVNLVAIQSASVKRIRELV